MKFFDELDNIITIAINEVMDDERQRQQRQSKAVDKLGLRAGDVNIEEVEEAEEEKDDEEPKKLKGKPSKEKPEDQPEEADQDEDAETPGTATSKKLKDVSKKQIKAPSFKSIANNINLLRGGKSIKDPEVRKNLQDYVDKLSVEERRQVLVYLNSLAQVMAGVKSVEAASDPEQAEREVKAKPQAEPKKAKAKSAPKSRVIVVGEE
jgi:hypothetical protein